MLRVWSLTCVVLLVGSLLSACRDSAPPRPYSQDLSTESHLLPPTSGPWLDLAVKDGRAEWVPFRSPEEKAAEPPAPEEETAKPSGVEGEIRALIKDYNEALAEKDFEGFLEYFVETQADTVEQMIEVLPVIVQKFSALGDAVAEKAPEAALGFIKLPADLSLEQALKLEVASLTVESETKVVGKVNAGNIPSLPAGLPIPPGMDVVNFVLGDDYWYVELPALNLMSVFLQQAVAQIDTLTEGVKSGQIPVEGLAAQFETLSKMFEQFAPIGQGNAAANETDEAPAEPMTEEAGEGGTE